MLKDKSKMKQASSSMLNYHESIFPQNLVMSKGNTLSKTANT